MELRKATAKECAKLCGIFNRKNIDYILPEDILEDYLKDRLYVVVENEKVLAIASLVPEPKYNYTAIKRLCICNKKNQGKGIAHFVIQELIKIVDDKIGATPWDNNFGMRHLLESEGFKLEYKFNIYWCFYSKMIKQGQNALREVRCSTSKRI